MTLIDDMRGMREEVRAVGDRVDRLRADLDRHEEQISGARGLSAAVADCAKSVKELHADFRSSRQGLSRGEKIALFASGTGFLGALAAAYAVLSGGAG